MVSASGFDDVSYMRDIAATDRGAITDQPHAGEPEVRSMFTGVKRRRTLAPGLL